MHVLILIIQFPPDVNSSGALMAQLGERLVERGHQVSVITSFPHYATFRVGDEYRGKLREREIYHGMEVQRLFVYASGNKRSMAQRLLSYLSFNALATFFGALSHERYDLILCSNGSFFSGLAATIIGALKGSPFIYNVQDLYPETPIQAGQLNNPLAIRILERLEKFMYSRAAHVSVIGPSMRDNIVDKGIDPYKVSVIPNFVDTSFIQPLPKDNAFSRHFGLVDKFVVTHAGNVGYVYDLATLLDAAALLRSKRDLRFLIVGDGVARRELEEKAQVLGLTNVVFLPYQPRGQLPMLRATSDVQVALYKNGSARYSMPSKVYEIMASGRPVLASADAYSDLANLVLSVGCGICVPPSTPVNLAAAISALYDDPHLRARMGERGRRVALSEYSSDVVAGRYDELVTSIQARCRSGARELVEEHAWR